MPRWVLRAYGLRLSGIAARAQKQWLSDKRRGLDSAPEDKLLKAEEDFRGYYEAQELFGEPGAVQQDAFWAALRAPLPVTLRVREPCATTEEKLRSGGWKRRWEFDKAGMSVWEMDSRQYAADSEQRSWAERENRRGLLCFQELVSLVPALLLSPQAGEVCLDLCAAPGNKSLQLLEELAQNGPSEGAVLSADNDAQRCCLTLHRVLGKAASPMSCAALANAGHFPVLVEERDGDPERLPCSKVLVDVPCSGDGTARKNSQVWRSWSRREALGLQRLQRQILLRALYLLPPGGVVVYSTCSLNPVENEAVVLSTLQKWQSSLGEGRGKLPVELLDAVAICREKCGLQPAPGLCSWQVPAPQRGGPLFNQFSEVPPELLEDDRYALRPEMFASGATQDLVRCARFHPQSSDTGGFFVAMFQKAPQTSAGRPAYSMPSSQIEGRGAHPLLSSEFRPVSVGDSAWMELTRFFQLDPAWVQDKLQRGLLFWQTMKGKTEPERVTLALSMAQAVARLWAARPSDGRKVAWARLGVFLFEQLPKGLMNGLAPCRWRLHAEGIYHLSSILRSRRITLTSELLRHLLCADHRQSILTEGTPLANAVASGAGGAETAYHHVCGGVIVGLGDSWLAGVVTPKQLRILADDDVAQALLEELPQPVRQLPSCWAAVAKICRFGQGV
ncbi:unnamed protein product [Effrenium voratum]|uniref:SAM-dependent MTase RsmB/NOP-type domain-containing protein n=1 Tax=Effrenium voratum TaxID=2562239 RepID=A0AA36IFF3_9DINO|nr:unnamed protein product [Effrenium voratum]